MKSFNTLLIANRGEIAVRIINTAKKMGYETVAIYSEADAGALHVTLADQAICIGESPASQSYLNIEKILNAAKQTDAEAIHPGYGFLSESPEFAQACESAGLIFVGPPASAVALMANKTVARHKMAEAGVPLVPGYDGASADDAILQKEADRIAYPLMVKAAAGGGGRGIRLVEDSASLLDAVASARAEALSTFASDELLLEKCVVNARHIEIQVFADHAGNTVYLGERDCSMQRRNQKVIEEAPAAHISEDLRQRMGEVAVQAAKAVAYVGAGTVEFLLSESGEFYFLEMNTRLQVEHPVTEMVTGEDLVEWQLRIATGENLPKTQTEIELSGHAIEVRLYAEDCENGFIPQTGSVISWQVPDRQGIRIDSGISNGQQINPYYDSMVAKIIAYGETRHEAIRRLRRGLMDTHLLGLSTNKNFLLKLLDEPVYLAGKATTRFIEEQFLPAQTQTIPPSNTIWALAAVLLTRTSGATGWRSTGTLRWPVRLSIRDETRDFYVSQQAQVFQVEDNPSTEKEPATITRLEILSEAGVNFVVRLDDIRLQIAATLDDSHLSDNPLIHIDTRTETATVEKLSLSNKTENTENEKNLSAPMSGRISEVKAKPGESVSKGDVLIVLESMKMFQELTARTDGIVAEVYISIDDQVEVGTALVDIEEKE